jgi:hypothetical protein
MGDRLSVWHKTLITHTEFERRYELEAAVRYIDDSKILRVSCTFYDVLIAILWSITTNSFSNKLFSSRSWLFLTRSHLVALLRVAVGHALTLCITKSTRHHIGYNLIASNHRLTDFLCLIVRSVNRERRFELEDSDQ